MSGKVYLVGAGPGDPGLITERGRRLLAEADLVLYDRLASAALLAHARPGAAAAFVGKEGGGGRTGQEAINRRMARAARRGMTVVRLKGGDPILFGRGAEEARFLEASRIPFEVVPGVSAAIAVPAAAGVPLTMRGLSASVTVLTGHEAARKAGGGVDWDRLLRADSTFVVLMGARNLAEIVRRFLAAGKDPRTPAAVIERGTTPLQRTVRGTLGRIAAAARRRRIAAPAVLVVGRAAAARLGSPRPRRLPLAGARVMVTRPARQAGGLARLLASRGAEPAVLPLVEIRPPRSVAPLDAAIDGLDRFDWIVFTSANGVRSFMGRLWARGLDARSLARLRVCAVGRPTADELLRWGVRADCVPPVYTTAAVAGALAARGEIRGRSFLLPRSDRAGGELPAAIRRGAGACREVTAYRTVGTGARAAAAFRAGGGGRLDLVVLTSPSAAREYARVARRFRAAGAGAPACAAIGPVTAAAARREGIRVAVEAAEQTDEGIVRAVESYWRRRRRAPRRRR